jgi:hypothetical protein
MTPQRLKSVFSAVIPLSFERFGGGYAARIVNLSCFRVRSAYNNPLYLF